MTKSLKWALCALLAVCGCNDCNGPVPLPEEQTASISVQALMPPSDQVVKVVLQVTWTGGQTPVVDMPKDEGTGFAALVEALPPEVPCAVAVDALDADGKALFTARLTGLVLPAGVVTRVVVNLEPTDQPDLGKAPVVESVSFPQGDVVAGSTVDIAVSVRDEDDASLAYTLTATAGTLATSDGTVTLSSQHGQISTTYTAPAEAGVVTLTVRVEDAQGLSAQLSFPLHVVPVSEEPQGGAGLFVINFPPEVTEVSARPAAGGGVELEATVVDDGPLAEVQYEWSHSGSVFGTANPASLAAGQGVVHVLLAVSDAVGARSTVEMDVDTTAAKLVDVPITNSAPVLRGAMRSSAEARYGHPLILRVWAEEPEGQPMTAAWVAARGAFASTRSYADGALTVFEATWTAPETVGSGDVVVTVRDPLGAAVAYRFSVTQVLGRVLVKAAAGPDQEVFVGDSAKLDGSASTSDDGKLTRYHWAQVSGPAATIAQPDSAATTVSVPTIGYYVFRLTVGNVNDQATDDVTVHVADPLAFTITDADLTSTGVAFFLDAANGMLRRYDVAANKFLSSVPAGPGAKLMAVAPDGTVAYVSDGTSRIEVVDVATGTRTLFGSTGGVVMRLAVAGGYVFAIDDSGAWVTQSLFSRATKVQTFAADWRYYSQGVAYAPGMSRLFHLRDDTSPNDILRTDVDQATGKLNADTDSPYHGDYSFTHPLRVFPDESKISVASGVIFRTSDLTYAGNLGMTYSDLRFSGNDPYLLRPSGSTQSQLVHLHADFSVADTAIYAGTPERLFIVGKTAAVFTKPSAGKLTVTSVALP